MNQQVDVFVTEDTLKFQSNKKYQTETNQGAGALRGVPKPNADSYHSKLRNQPSPGDSKSHSTQPTKALFLRSATQTGKKSSAAPPLRPSAPGAPDEGVPRLRIGSQGNQQNLNPQEQDREPFSYQRISETDEKEAGFVELSIL